MRIACGNDIVPNGTSFETDVCDVKIQISFSFKVDDREGMPNSSSDWASKPAEIEHV